MEARGDAEAGRDEAPCPACGVAHSTDLRWEALTDKKARDRALIFTTILNFLLALSFGSGGGGGGH